ncbi:MAG: DUF4118 domain-containing protein [Gemmatimonadaceae bacterium]|nr:DUF4118 domain-containing protein [Gemmatimonadaceae bacterium]
MQIRSRMALHAAVIVGVTLLMLPLRERLDKAHVTLAYLLAVLIASADGGRRIGLLSASLAFLTFNWFFLPPYGTLIIAEPLDWFVLASFLVTSIVASHLFHRVQREAEEARARTREVSSLATVGTEAMRAPRAEGALQSLAEGARVILEADRCTVVVNGIDAGAPALRVVGGSGSAEPLTMAADRGTGVATLPDDASRLFPLALADAGHPLDGCTIVRIALPLSSHERGIGSVTFDLPTPRIVTPELRRVLGALHYYIALGADRWRLEGASEHVEALREADRLKNAVLASVSHDLRTPLTTISALAHDLGTLGDERSEIIAQEAARLNRFVSDLLDVSRLTAGGVRVHPEVVPVEDLLAAALQQVEGAFADRRIQVRMEAGDPLLLGRFDPVQSVRIIVNLLENAHKYAPTGTLIDLVARRDDGYVVIEVGDRGPGIPPDEVDRIFAPLYRPAGSRPDAGSAGLGLAIARGFAEAQGGSVRYRPRDAGGSVFEVTLPVAGL